MSSIQDPRCPECGGPIGPTATYCLHCSADLTDRTPVDGAAASADTGVRTRASNAARGGEPMLDPEGFVDDSLTVIVGIVGGCIVGLVATFLLLILTASLWGLVGILVGLGAIAYLARQDTVQAAISKAAYGVALVLLLAPLVPLSPATDMALDERATGFVTLLFLVGIPALGAAGIGYLASRFVSDETTATAAEAADDLGEEL